MSTHDVIEVVLLDLDDTLLDHRGSASRALAKWLPTLGATASARVHAAWFELEEQYWAGWRAGEFPLAESRRRRVAGLLARLDLPPMDDAGLDESFDQYVTAYQTSWFAFPDTLPTLDELAATGLRLAVLTNGATKMQRAKLDAIGATPYLEAVFTAEDLQLAKPDRAVYREVCRRLETTPDAALHVGDRHDLDVLAARTAGLLAVHLDRRGTGPLGEPNRIATLRDLAAFVVGRRADRFT